MKLNYLSPELLTRKKIPLPAGDSIDICIFSIKNHSLLTDNMEILSAQEQQKASSLRQEKDRIRFITSRLLLRRFLSLYLNYPAKKLIFEINKHGKPYLAFAGNDCPGIHFNLSHSGEFIALAFSVVSPVGIDIETARENIHMETLVRRFFHPDEYSEFLKLDKTAQKDFMFRRWTVREAFLKGIGTGFSTSPDSFYVQEFPSALRNSADRQAAPSVFRIKKSQEDYSSWRIESIPAPDGYYSSIAYQISE